MEQNTTNDSHLNETADSLQNEDVNKSTYRSHLPLSSVSAENSSQKLEENSTNNRYLNRTYDGFQNENHNVSINNPYLPSNNKSDETTSLKGEVNATYNKHPNDTADFSPIKHSNESADESQQFSNSSHIITSENSQTNKSNAKYRNKSSQILENGTELLNKFADDRSKEIARETSFTKLPENQDNSYGKLSKIQNNSALTPEMSISIPDTSLNDTKYRQTIENVSNAINQNNSLIPLLNVTLSSQILKNVTENALEIIGNNTDSSRTTETATSISHDTTLYASIQNNSSILDNFTQMADTALYKSANTYNPSNAIHDENSEKHPNQTFSKEENIHFTTVTSPNATSDASTEIDNGLHEHAISVNTSNIQYRNKNSSFEINSTNLSDVSINLTNFGSQNTESDSHLSEQVRKTTNDYYFDALVPSQGITTNDKYSDTQPTDQETRLEGNYSTSLPASETNDNFPTNVTNTIAENILQGKITHLPINYPYSTSTTSNMTENHLADSLLNNSQYEARKQKVNGSEDIFNRELSTDISDAAVLENDTSLNNRREIIDLQNFSLGGKNHSENDIFVASNGTFSIVSTNQTNFDVLPEQDYFMDDNEEMPGNMPTVISIHKGRININTDNSSKSLVNNISNNNYSDGIIFKSRFSDSYSFPDLSSTAMPVSMHTDNESEEARKIAEAKFKSFEDHDANRNVTIGQIFYSEAIITVSELQDQNTSKTDLIVDTKGRKDSFADGVTFNINETETEFNDTKLEHQNSQNQNINASSENNATNFQTEKHGSFDYSDNIYFRHVNKDESTSLKMNGINGTSHEINENKGLSQEPNTREFHDKTSVENKTEQLKDTANLENPYNIPRPLYLLKNTFEISRPKEISDISEDISSSVEHNSSNVTKIMKETTLPLHIISDKEFHEFSTYFYLKHTYTPDQMENFHNHDAEEIVNNTLENNNKSMTNVPYVNDNSSIYSSTNLYHISTNLFEKTPKDIKIYDLTNAPEIKENFTVSEQENKDRVSTKSNFDQLKIADNSKISSSSVTAVPATVKELTNQEVLSDVTTLSGTQISANAVTFNLFNTSKFADANSSQKDARFAKSVDNRISFSNQSEIGNRTLDGIIGEEGLPKNNTEKSKSQVKNRGSPKSKASPVSKLIQLCPSAGKKCNRRLLERCIKHLKEESESNCRTITYDDVITAANGHNPTNKEKSVKENTKRCFKRIHHSCSREGFDCIVNVFYIKENKESALHMCYMMNFNQ